MNKRTVEKKKGQTDRINPTFIFTDQKAIFCPETHKAQRLEKEILIQNFDFIDMDWDIEKI